MTAERSVFQRAVLQPVEHPFDGVYCADRRLNSVLDAEGLAVLNPEDLVQYPPLVHRCPPPATLGVKCWERSDRILLGCAGSGTTEYSWEDHHLLSKLRPPPARRKTAPHRRILRLGAAVGLT